MIIFFHILTHADVTQTFIQSNIHPTQTHITRAFMAGLSLTEWINKIRISNKYYKRVSQRIDEIKNRNEDKQEKKIVQPVQQVATSIKAEICLV